MVSRKSALLAVVLAAAVVGSAADAFAKKKDKPEEKGAARAVAGAEIAATVGDRTITLEELDAKALAASFQPFQALYEARRAALDGMIADLLFEREAQARGITKEELTAQEIDQKVEPVTDDAISAFYEQNKGRMGGRPLDQVKDPVRDYLTAQGRQEAATAFLDGLKTKAGVKIRIEPPRLRVELASNDPSRGPATAPVQIYEFSDFQCPFCSRVKPTVKQIIDTYGDKVRLVFVDLPLPMHPNAHIAAEAAQCANDAGKFWEYHDKLFENQGALGAEQLKQYASDLGLDGEAFNACLDSGKHREAVAEDMRKAQGAGVTGTPAFLINGRFVSGAQPFEAFETIIEDELQRAGLARASTTKP